MTDPLSLTLLKGQNADAPPEDPGVDTTIDQVEDILTASVKALENLLKENETAHPEGWAEMTLGAKRAWVLGKYEADADATAGKAEDPPFTPDPPKPAAEAAPPAKPAKGKKAKADEPKTKPAAAAAPEQDQGTDVDEAPGPAEAAGHTQLDPVTMEPPVATDTAGGSWKTISTRPSAPISNRSTGSNIARRPIGSRSTMRSPSPTCPGKK
jgi:hypothetical protein